MLEPLRQGIFVEGIHLKPMEVSFDRQTGANAWLSIGLREGKNREIRKALGFVGLPVNRLLRISFGDFELGTLKKGEVQEVRLSRIKNLLKIRLDSSQTEKKQKRGFGTKTSNKVDKILGRRNVSGNRRRNK